MQIPDLTLGTAMWGWTIAKKDCFALLDHFYAKGYRSLDGATNYPINKNPKDFRLSEKILMEWIATHGVEDLEVIMKVGSINNLRTPDHNLTKSFLIINLDDYQKHLGKNLDTFMIHWDNRSETREIATSFEVFAEIKKRGLRIGLSGIKHPELYGKLNETFDFQFRIQCKHNLLKSDYQRYAIFHNNALFMAYGINAGGIKFSLQEYHSNSSLKLRGGNIEETPPVVHTLKELIKKHQKETLLKSFNHCALVFAAYSPDFRNILIGPSSVEQLKGTIDFHRSLASHQLLDFYDDLSSTLTQ